LLAGEEWDEYVVSGQSDCVVAVNDVGPIYIEENRQVIEMMRYVMLVIRSNRDICKGLRSRSYRTGILSLYSIAS
jgi:hypothetical protein